MRAYCTSITILGVEFKRSDAREHLRDTFESDDGIFIQRSGRDVRPWAAFRKRKDGSTEWLEDRSGRVRTFKTLENAGTGALDAWHIDT